MNTVREMRLSGGYIAIVDAADFGWLSQWKWSADVRAGGHIYASRTIVLPDGRRSTVRLHRAITQAPKGMDVDHIDGNTLNNARANLRVCTRAQNTHNSKARAQNTTGYKGVSRSAHGGSWFSQISVHGRYRHLGHYSSPEAAAVAFDTAAIALQGEFAHLNFALNRDWIVPQDLSRAFKDVSEFQPIAPQDRRAVNG
jgi:hypothetical protein